jgi:iron complex outermembrane receptor protein
VRAGDAWRLDAQYAASDRTHLYASVATGYTGGGLEYDMRSGRLDAFGPEELVAYETGIKSSSRGGRLRVNAAAFYYDYRDIQVNVYESVGTLPVFGIDNAAQARLYGIDAEAVFRATEHVELSAGMVWMPEREFTEYLDVDEDGDLLDFSGKQLVRAPELSATFAIDAAFPLPGLGSLAARLEYDYRSHYYFTRENDPGFSQDDFGLLNARVKFEPEGGDWYLFASAWNLADEDYFNQVFLQSSPGLPCTWELGAGLRF